MTAYEWRISDGGSDVCSSDLCDRGRSPGAFKAAGDRVVAHAAAVPALPAQSLLRDVRAFRLRADLRCIARAMALAECVAAGRQRHRLLVVHRHAGPDRKSVV